MFLPELAGLTPEKIAAAPQNELTVVDQEITDVITGIDTAVQELEDINFPVAGHIAKDSFGGSALASHLAVHHTRAHAVTVEMLKDLKADLHKFRDAIRAARNGITEADTEAGLQLKQVLAGVETIDMGRTGYDQGKNDHAYDQPTGGVPDAENI